MAMLLAVTLIFTGCNKLIDYWKKNPGKKSPCRITNITYEEGSSIKHLDITYNGYGNPVNLFPSEVGTGRPQLEFRYDSPHRLSELIGYYDNTLFETWRKFYYDQKGRIIRDTLSAFGQLGGATPGPEPATYEYKYMNEYEYDSEDRMVKWSSYTVEVNGVDTLFPNNVITYSYGPDGNLVRPGVTYDNKINLHRTNKIWMFLARDYSYNNPFAAVAYNAYQLPVEISSGPAGFISSYSLTTATVTYDCN